MHLALSLALVACSPQVASSPSPAASTQRRAPWVRSVRALGAEMEQAGSGPLMPQRTQGYAFTLSPDEAWLALVSTAEDDSNRLCVFHLPSRRTWSAPVSEGDPLGYIGRWFPSCFSADGRTIYYGSLAAPLAAGMPALVLAEDGSVDPGLLQATCLGLNPPLKNTDGTVVSGWYGLTQDEGEFGELAWSADGTIQYRPQLDDHRRRALLVATPPGVRQGVRYGRLLALENELVREGFDQFVSDPARLPPNASAEEKQQIARMAQTLIDSALVDERSACVTLEQLAVSPDGQNLAAEATLYRTAIGDGPKHYAVLIPLRRGGLEAFPLAQDSYGKLIWGRDSQSLYLKGAPLDTKEPGGILRLELDLAALPAHIEVEPLPPDER